MGGQQRGHQGPESRTSLSCLPLSPEVPVPTGTHMALPVTHRGGDDRHGHRAPHQKLGLTLVPRECPTPWKEGTGTEP